MNPDGGGMNPDGGGMNPDGGGSTAWKTIALPGDHDGDEVSGIYFSSANAGVITTVAGTGTNAGAVFSVTATSVSGTAFDGDVSQSAGGVLGGLNFQGVVTTSAGGLVAITDTNDLVSAPTATGTFANVKMGTGPGGGQGAGAYFGSNVTLLAQDLNGFYKATSAPGANATFTDIFDPSSIPTVPDPLPATDCQDEIRVSDAFESGLGSVAFSADGTTIVYTTYSDADGVPEVCVSTDGGQTFLPTEITGKPQVIPGGVIFPKPSAPSTMIVYSGGMADPGANYIVRSTDGGKTFSAATLPSGIATKSLELFGAFFLADGQHGWIVGADDDADTGLALVTTDGGQTWTVDSTVTAATSEKKLHSVFALDTSHVWMGGESGAFIAHTP